MTDQLNLDRTVTMPPPTGDLHLMAPFPDAVERLASVRAPAGGELVIRVYDGEGELPEGADQTEVWVPPFLPRADLGELVAQLPKLKLVQLLTAGVEVFAGRLPEEIVLCNARGAPSPATAEWCVGVLLSLYRSFPRFAAAQAEGRWEYAFTEELGGKRVLIVGAGDVADTLARQLSGFDVEITLVARRARDGVAGVEQLPELLPRADAVVLLVPLTEQTRGLVDADFLARMPDGAILVNAARGPVVVTEDLVDALHSGRLRAALDVTDPEPLPAGHPLWTAPNLLLTPHVAGSVPSTADRAVRIVLDQLSRYVAGEPLSNVVFGAY